MIYKCIKEFKIPFADEDGSMTDNYGVIEKNSLWELNEGVYSITGAELHLDSINYNIKTDSFSWVEIDRKTLIEKFIESEV